MPFPSQEPASPGGRGPTSRPGGAEDRRQGSAASGRPAAAPLGPRPVIASFAELRARIREDRTVNPGFWAPGFQAIATYRLGCWCNGIRNRPLRAGVRLVHRLLALVMRNVYGIELSERTLIGRRLRIAHQNGIVIHGQAVIGDDCLIRQGVTLGSLGGGRGSRTGVLPGAPRLGDRVEVGVGAVLVGPIRVGDDVVIGPNAVVMTHVPAGALVSAPPARVIAPPPRRDTTPRDATHRDTAPRDTAARDMPRN